MIASIRFAPTRIAESVLVRIAGASPTELTAGRYLYCGSAKGPGGLRARLARHMRLGKPVHWPIDQLTERGIVIGSWIVFNGRECELVAMLGALPMPIPRFGSSDRMYCRSHLLYWPTGVSVPGQFPPSSEVLKCSQQPKLDGFGIAFVRRYMTGSSKPDYSRAVGIRGPTDTSLSRIRLRLASRNVETHPDCK